MLKLILIIVAVLVLFKIFSSALKFMFKIIFAAICIYLLLTMTSCSSKPEKHEVVKKETKDSVKIDSTLKNAGKEVGKATKTIVKGFNTFTEGFKEEIKK